MKKQLLQFVGRWFFTSFSLWIVILINLASFSGGYYEIMVASLILALINLAIRPLLVIVALPLITLTMGLFMIVVNGALLYLLSAVYSRLVFENFIMAMVAGTLVGLVNYIVTLIYERLDRIE